MIYKYLEKKVTIVSEDSIYEGNNPMELEYYLTESNSNYSEDFDQEKQYGIEIVKIINGETIENKLVRNLTCCKEEAQKVLGKLIYNTVTPMGVLFVLDDILCE